jgi:hypothetical protein
MEMREQKIISFETARVLLEVEDPILEDDLVKKDLDEEFERQKELAAAGIGIPTPQPGNPDKKESEQ